MSTNGLTLAWPFLIGLCWITLRRVFWLRRSRTEAWCLAEGVEFSPEVLRCHHRWTVRTSLGRTAAVFAAYGAWGAFDLYRFASGNRREGSLSAEVAGALMSASMLASYLLASIVAIVVGHGRASGEHRTTMLQQRSLRSTLPYSAEQFLFAMGLYTALGVSLGTALDARWPIAEGEQHPWPNQSGWLVGAMGAIVVLALVAAAWAARRPIVASTAEELVAAELRVSSSVRALLGVAAYALATLGMDGWMRAATHSWVFLPVGFVGALACLGVLGWFGTYSDTRNDRLVRLRRAMTGQEGAVA